MESLPYWQLRVVVAEGGGAVRFLGPHRHTVVEIPAAQIAEAARLLGYDVQPAPKGGA